MGRSEVTHAFNPTLHFVTIEFAVSFPGAHSEISETNSCNYTCTYTLNHVAIRLLHVQNISSETLAPYEAVVHLNRKI